MNAVAQTYAETQSIPFMIAISTKQKKNKHEMKNVAIFIKRLFGRSTAMILIHLPPDVPTPGQTENYLYWNLHLWRQLWIAFSVLRSKSYSTERKVRHGRLTFSKFNVRD